MSEQTDFYFSMENLYGQLSKLGDPLEVLSESMP